MQNCTQRNPKAKLQQPFLRTLQPFWTSIDLGPAKNILNHEMRACTSYATAGSRGEGMPTGLGSSAAV